MLSVVQKMAVSSRAGLPYRQIRHGALAYKAMLAYENIGTRKKKEK